MALIQPGPIASDIRGSMGGSVFSRNRSGLYIRRRVAPVNPQTPSQTQIRDYVAQLQARFRDTLTAAQRAAWAASANASTAKNKLGLGITLTPQNVYLKINTIALKVGLSEIDDPAPPPLGTDAPDITVTGDTTDGLQITALTPALGAGDGFLMQVSPALNQTVNFYKGPWGLVYTTNGVTAPPTVLIIAASLAIGERYHWRYRFLSAAGRISNYITGVTDILA